MVLKCAMIPTSFWLCGSVLADNCSGHYTQVVTQFQSIDLGGGHKIDMFWTKSTNDSTNSPYNGVGQCTSYAHAMPDGTVRWAGICGWKNNDGSFAEEWALEPGAEKGTWKSAGGTGVYAAKSASGWWQVIVSEGGVTLGEWGGNCN
jgi:hypothetical protein